MKLLPRNAVVAEVGVAFGDFSDFTLKVLEPFKFVAIDTFELHKFERVFDVSSAEKFEGLSHGGWFLKRFKEYVEKGVMEVQMGLSWDMLGKYPDNYFDIIYLDADHSYDSVRKDLNVIKYKIKAGGTIIFNDYTVFDPYTETPYGVPKAVNEFIVENNCEVIFFALQPTMFFDLAVKFNERKQ
ncbi:MAG: class I SAM-dependent methyltransferase [Nitrospirae bacterium]|nr:class I SAM-dependent methyltransferase [Nitrospirota bacterium]